MEEGKEYLQALFDPGESSRSAAVGADDGLGDCFAAHRTALRVEPVGACEAAAQMTAVRQAAVDRGSHADAGVNESGT